MGTHEGELWRLKNSVTWQAQTNLVHPITTIVANTNGTMWMGTEGDGVYEFNDSAHTHLGHWQWTIK